MYFSLLAEMGLVGVTVFVCLLVGIIRTLTNVIRAGSGFATIHAQQQSADALEEQQRTHSAALLAKAILCSLAGYLIAGAFISVTYYPHIWLIAAFATIVRYHSTKIHDLPK